MKRRHQPEPIRSLERPRVSKDPGTREWQSFCWHGGNNYDLALFRSHGRALAYALQHVEDAHACVSTP